MLPNTLGDYKMCVMPYKKSDIAARFKEICDSIAGGQATKFAEMLSTPEVSISRTAVKGWMDGKQLPRIDFACKAAHLYGKSLDWLVTGNSAPRTKTVGAVLDEKLARAGISMDPDSIEHIATGPLVSQMISLVDGTIEAVVGEVVKTKAERKKKG